MGNNFKKILSKIYWYKLKDPRWRIKQKEILKRDDNKCIICKSTEKLNIHHRQYHFSKHLNRFIDPWEYKDYYLITLCKKCHKAGHFKYKVPTKNIV